MTNTDADRTLGTCPACGVSIPHTRLLLQYEDADYLAVFAECSACRAIVYPE